MKKQQLSLRLALSLILIIVSISLRAQTLSRAQMFNNIVSNVYTNPNHIITGQTLQNVFLNQNYSYNNLKSDTDFLSVFDTGFTYFKGMAVLTLGDSLYRCDVPVHHGPWDSIDFRFVQAIGVGSGGISGGGDVPYIPVFTDKYTLSDSHITDGKNKQFMLDWSFITSIDWNKRLLYNSAGTKFLTWENGASPLNPTDIISKGYGDATYKPGISSSGSNPYIPVFTAGNAVGNSHIMDGAGSQVMFDNLSNVSIDWTKRYLYNLSTSNFLTWGNGTAPTAPTDIICKAYADATYNGGTSSMGGVPYVAVFTANHTIGNSHIIDGGGNQQMLDTILTASVDWLNRSLYSSGASTFLTWGNGTAPTAPTDIISKGYADATYTAGTSSTGNTPYVPVFTAPNTIGNSHIIDGGGNQQMLDTTATASIDWLNRSLYSSDASTFLTWGNGTTPTAPTDIISKAYADATYTGGGGGGISSTGNAPYVAVFTAHNTIGNGHIIDGGGSQLMMDNLAAVSIDWLNRTLYSAAPTSKLSWANGVNPMGPTDIITKGYADATYITLLGSTGGYHGPIRPVSSSETWLGGYAGGGSVSTDNTTFIGIHTGDGALGAHRSTFLGAYAGYQAPGSWNAIFIGDSAGFQDRLAAAGGWSILIGPKTATNGFDNSIALGGYAANTGPNQLYIADNINNFHLAGNTYKVPPVGGTLALMNYHFDIPMVTNYRIPVTDFDGQTVVEILGTPAAIATMPNPATVARGIPVIIKATGTPSTTTLNVVPFGAEMIDNNTAGILMTMATAQSPQPCVKILTPDNINWITIP